MYVARFKIKTKGLPIRAPYSRGEGNRAKSESADIRTIILADLSFGSKAVVQNILEESKTINT